MRPIVAGPPRQPWTTFAGVAGVMAAASIGWIAANYRSPVPWLAAVICGTCALYGGWCLYDARPRLVIDDRGVLDRTFGIGRVPWRDVQGVELKAMHGQPHLCLTLRNAAAYTDRLAPQLRRIVTLDRQLGFSDLSISLAGASATPADVLAAARTQLTHGAR